MAEALRALGQKSVGLRAGGRLWALPSDAMAVEPAALRPAPLAGGAVLGIAVVGGQVVPVLAVAPGLPGGAAWVMLDGPQGRLVLAGEAFEAEVPDDTPLLAPPGIAARRVPAPMPALSGGWAVPIRSGAARQLAVAAELGGERMVLPLSMLERVVTMPALRTAPGGGVAVLGYAVAAGAPVLVLAPGWLVGPMAATADASLLMLFRHGGRRLGLPCARVGPARPNETSLEARLDAALEDFAMAPLVEQVPMPPPEPMRTLLLCSAGGQSFALPVEDVVAVIPPLAPTLTPRSGLAEARMLGFRGVAAHRGDVLPVLDAGQRMGLGSVMVRPGQQAPMLRLAGVRPVALAVSQVTGLRQVPERLVATVAGDGLVSAIATLGEAALPVCRGAVLGGLR